MNNFLGNVDSVLRNQEGSGELPPHGPYTTIIDPPIPQGDPLIVKIWERIKQIVGMDQEMILESNELRSRNPKEDTQGNMHCGLCGRFVFGSNHPNSGECEHCDVEGNAPSRFTPRRIAQIVDLAGQEGTPVDRDEVIRRYLGRPLAPEQRFVTPEGDEIGVWGNGFVGKISPDAMTDEGLDITRIKDTNVRVEPVDRSIIRESIQGMAIGGADWSSASIRASAEGDWVSVSVRSPKKNKRRQIGVVRRKDIGDVVSVHLAGGYDFQSSITMCVEVCGIGNPDYVPFDPEELEANG